MVQLVLKSRAKRGLRDPFCKWETENTGNLSDLFKAVPKIDGKARTEPEGKAPKILVTFETIPITAMGLAFESVLSSSQRTLHM